MSTNELEVQPAQIIEEERTEDPLDDEPPKTKSGVQLKEIQALQNARFKKGDNVHMSLIENGARVKGTYTVEALKYNSGGHYVEYRLCDTLTNQLYRHGAWTRESLLKGGR